MPERRFAFYQEPLATSAESARVFSDPEHVRGKRVRRRFAVLLAMLIAWTFFFFNGVQSSAVEPLLLSNAGEVAVPTRGAQLAFGPPQLQPVRNTAADVSCANADQPFTAMAEGAGFGRVFAHLPISLEWAHLSLERSCQTIDVLVTDWITVVETSDGFAVEVVSADTRRPVETFLENAIARPEIMPRLQFDLPPVASSFAAKIADGATRAGAIADLRLALEVLGSAGACLDLGQFPRSINPKVRPFVREMRQALEVAGLSSCIIVSGNAEDWRETGVTDGFDHVIVRMFYEPWVGSAPTPLSDNEWFAEQAADLMAELGPERFVPALGTFGANWETRVPLPRRLSYGEVMAAVGDAGAELTFNADVSGSFAAFQDASGARQKFWLQDAASAYNQMAILAQAGVSNLGIWSLGQEDPGLWPLLSGQLTPSRLYEPALTDVSLDTFVEYEGTGPALRVMERGSFGYRTFDIDPQTGLIAGQTYQSYPQPYQMERFGAPAANEVILTFDDGPHPEFTPQILDILAETGTPAAFFVLGQNVMNHRDILRRLMAEGHEVGTHSFSHPRMDQISASRTHLEHALTDRAVASATGHATLLYREPFLRSGGPISADRIEPLAVVQSRGQINYGMDVVPKDWLGLSSAEIAAYVIEQVESGAGNTILLHDGGGADRSASVAALPVIITELRARGYVFTSISDSLGLEKDVLMPLVTGLQPAFDRVSFAFASSTMSGLVILFWVVLLIGVGRSLMILWLALCRRRHYAIQAGPYAKVAVIIPAFNEEAALVKCVDSVLASNYPALEVVIVDDGSTDNTLNRIFDFKHERNVRMISQPNQGKWSALNRAIQTLDADVAVCIDADTQVAPDAILKLASHFQNPKVGAVAGKIVVGNQNRLLTKMQALEYVTAQNFERRAFDHINGILVVPGAIGAWRVSALRKVGLYCADTMTEDCDLTISVNRAGYRVVYDERAVAYTEAPQTLRALLAQRLRWSLGMFQSAWKHKRAMIEGRSIGTASIPDMFIFGYLFPLLAPLADLFVVILLYQLLSGSWSGEVGSGVPLISPEMLWAYLALPAVEFLVAAVAVMTDRTAPKSLILIWPFQRIFYRPLLYLTVFRAVLRALMGTLAVWGTSKRQGGNLMREARRS